MHSSSNVNVADAKAGDENPAFFYSCPGAAKKKSRTNAERYMSLLPEKKAKTSSAIPNSAELLHILLKSFNWLS
jgi:hypothetical protein